MDYIPPPHHGLDIRYLDDALLVVDKPAGLLSVPGRGEDKQDCMISRVQAEFPDALTVHRLDMSTSGLLVIARGAEMHRSLSMAFQDRRVHKRYVALLAGQLAAASGSVELPLITDWPNRPRQMVDWTQGKPSLTHYRLIGHEGDSSRVELEPVTGRSHQLRVHMCEIGHPILGDDLYGGERTQAAVLGRLMLHASRLEFAHPQTGAPLVVESPVPF